MYLYLPMCRGQAALVDLSATPTAGTSALQDCKVCREPHQ